MNQWTIRRRIAAGFGVLTLLAASLGLFSLATFGRIGAHVNTITEDNLPGIYFVGQLRFLSHEGFELCYDHILASTPEERERVEKEMAKINSRVEDVLGEYRRTMTQQEDRDLFAAMIPLRTAYLEAREARAIAPSRAGRREEALAGLRGPVDEVYGPFEQALERLVQYNRDFGMRTARGISRSVAEGRTGLVIAVVAIPCLIAGVSFLITRSIDRRLGPLAAGLQTGALQLAEVSSQISASGQKVAEGASDQAASLEEASASLEEIASMTRSNASNAETAKQCARETRAAADAGAAELREMHTAMAEIREASSNIASIIKTIDEIAFQTNILALNAAVEAARAGEAGMGFAVVAEEVRSLAQRCAQAASETSERIEDSIRKSENGAAISEKVAGSLNEMIGKARRVDELVAEIATACHEQSQGVIQVNKAVSQIDSITQANAAMAEESASASEELHAQANSLRDAVANLSRLVGNSGTGQGKSDAARPNSRTTLAHAGRTPSQLPSGPASGASPVAHAHGTPHRNGAAGGVTRPQAQATSAGAANGAASGAPGGAAGPRVAVLASKRDQIPMGDDFKDF